MSETTAEKKSPKLESVKLNQAHTHGRTNYKKDDVIEVPAHTADYIERNKIGSRQK